MRKHYFHFFSQHADCAATRSLHVLFLILRYGFTALSVLAAKRFIREPCLRDLPRHVIGYDALPHAEDVRIVVRARHARREEVVHNDGTRSLDLVRHYAHRRARTTDEDAEFVTIFRDLLRHTLRIGLRVARFLIMRTHVLDAVARVLKLLQQELLHRIARMIRAYDDRFFHYENYLPIQGNADKFITHFPRIVKTYYFSTCPQTFPESCGQVPDKSLDSETYPQRCRFYPPKNVHNSNFFAF